MRCIMAIDITLDYVKKRKCMICGDMHKSIANVMLGQTHIATVVTCCNCGFTLTFAHSASEYAKYLETGEYDYHTSICLDEPDHCLLRENCPKIQKGRKI